MADDKIVTKRGIYLYINGQQINNDLKSVQGELKKLQNEQAKMTIGSEKYIQTGKKIQALDSIIQEHRKQWRNTNAEIEKTKTSILSLGKLTDSFNKYFGVLTAFIASFTGLTFAMRKCVDDFASLEEGEANVRKYTGMTKEEVKDLNEAFKNMDTRAARTKLNQLAADAGRLGIQGKKDLLEFVEGANIINVSLGDDLGEDAVKNIGKLAQMFGTADEKGLKAGMLSVASAVNEVAQNSSAAEKYLVEFTARVAGTGKQAGIAIPQIMGYASVLDQNMLRSEMAATAVQKVWLKMYQEPAKFAKLAGKSVQEFTDLVLSDANEAFLQLMENLSKSSGLINLAPIFEEMKLDGTEAIGVLNTIVASVGKIRKEQEVATKAFEAGTSVIDEYNVQNNTLQATIEKAKKKFQEYSYLLGEKLAPYMGMVVSKSSSLLKIIAVLIEFFIKYGAGLTKITVVLLAYIAAQKLHVMWGQRTNALTAAGIALNTTYRTVLAALAVVYNLLRGRLFAAQIAMIAFNKVVQLNPIGLLISALTALGMVIANYINKQREANKYTRQMKTEILEEETAANKLFTALKLAGQGTDQRSRLIEAINEKYGDYLPNLLNEESSLKDIKSAQDAVNTAIRTNIALKTQKEAVDNIEREALEDKAEQIDDIRAKLAKKLPASEVELALSRIVAQADKAVEKGFNAKQALAGVFSNLKKDFFGGNAKNMDPQTANEVEDYIDLVYKTAAKMAKEKAKYQPFISPLPAKNVLPEVTITAKKVVSTVTKDEMTDKERKKALKKETEDLENAYKEQTVAIKREYIKRNISEEQMQRQLFSAETLFLSDKINIYKKYKENTADIEVELTDKIIAETKRREAVQKKSKVKPEEEKPDENPLWAELAKGTEIQIAMNEAMYNAGLISHQEYLYKKGILDEKYRKEKAAKDKVSAEQEKQIRESILGTISSLANSAVSVIQAAQSREEAAIEKKYKYKLLLAEGDNEATAELEEEKEAELLAVRKKYADKAFAMNVLAITADTAVAAMRAYSAMAGIPIVGPALGIAAATAAVVAGAAQIAVANQQREQAANMWDGGFTGEGGKYEKKKLIQTHGGEFVANKKTVQILRPVFDIMDYAQKTGNVTALTGPDMARALGSSSTPSTSTPNNQPVAIGQTASTNPDIIRALDNNTRTMAALKKKLEEPFVGEVYIDGPKGVKQNLTDYDKLIKNATR